MQVLADLEARGGNVAAARALHERAAELPAAGAPQLVAWGKFEERQGRSFEAMALYRRVLKQDADFAPALQVQLRRWVGHGHGAKGET